MGCLLGGYFKPAAGVRHGGGWLGPTAGRRGAVRTIIPTPHLSLSAGPSGSRPPSLPVFSGAEPGSLDTLATAALLELGSGPPIPATGTAPPSSAASLSPAPSTGSIPAAVATIPGFSSLPPRLIRRIVAREFIDMSDLLPEAWRVDPAAQTACCPHTKRPRRAVVTDILIWAECYATMAAVLAAAFPEKAPHFFAHLRTVVKAARNFEGSAWASYDMVVRRQAANRGCLDWGCVDNATYSEAFTGRARLIPRCIYCLGDTHSSQECVYAPAPADPHPATSPSLPQPRPPARQLPAVQPPARQMNTVEICRLFNAGACRFPRCRYAHICARCRLPHPATECSDRRRFTGGPPPPPPAPPRS